MLRAIKHSISNLFASLAIADLLLITLTCQVTFIFLSMEDALTYSLYSLPISLCLSLMTVFVAAACGLYDTVSLQNFRSLLSRMVSTAIVALAAGLLAHGLIFRSLMDWIGVAVGPSGVELIYLLAACVGTLFLTRLLFMQLAQSSLLNVKMVAVGNANELRFIEGLSSRFPQAIYDIAFKLRTDKSLRMVTGGDPIEDGDARTLSLREIAIEKRANTIIVAENSVHSLPIQDVLECRLAGMNVTEAMDFIERCSGRVDFQEANLEKLVLAPDGPSSVSSEVSQRAIDLVLSALLMILLLPIMLAAALAIKIQDGGDIFYRQERVGRNGSLFSIMKFRSMRPNAENPDTPVWSSSDDPRVTAIGSVLRKFRIDEIPQLFNVIKGDMSLVGPRPERPYFVNQLAYAIPTYLLRHSVKPGITGWAQVNFKYGASAEDARIKHSYDLYYIKHRGILIYLLVLLRTIRVVLWPIT